MEAFERLGAEPLRQRAQREQDLTGAPGRRGSSGAWAMNRLTAQGRRAAQLAAEQLTNREIDVQLRISHRTVGHHLGNVFASSASTPEPNRATSTPVVSRRERREAAAERARDASGGNDGLPARFAHRP
ncbi:hypothetical protein [Streptomyces typhae]|uniref:hypothetical protein n=1 Tax=Streptomyces typhae TaxID=2681492 RepID=UPI001FE69380|nr:hypothetical protein [Streptomyces typhae]